LKRRFSPLKKRSWSPGKRSGSIGERSASPGKPSVSLSPLINRKKVTREDVKDASAQADLWMAIAAQSKQEGTAKGASDAADWAISRSLTALLQAEKKGGSSFNSNQSVGSNSSSKGDDSV